MSSDVLLSLQTALRRRCPKHHLLLASRNDLEGTPVLEEKDKALKIRPHEVSGIAPTLLFRRNFAVDQVLRAGVWKNQSTFTAFYLRDIAHKSLDTFFLGPIVAAQGVV